MAQSSELLAEPRDTRPHLHTVFQPYSIVSHLTLASPFPGSTFMPAQYSVYVYMWGILWTTQKQLEIHTRCTVNYGFVFPEEWKCASQVGSALVQLGSLGLEEALTTCPRQTNEKGFIKIIK